MIVLITPDTPITAGQFVCAKARGLGTLCTYPRKVTRVVGKRIYFIHDEGDVEQYMARERAGFRCDTAEEGMALCKLGERRDEAVREAQQEAYRRVVAEFEPKVLALMEGREVPE